MPSAFTINHHNDHWQIWIDTGGTFTDCLAIEPGGPRGSMHRAKVLSSGALRGRIAGQSKSHQLIVQQNWGACDDFIAGFDFALQNRPESRRRVVGFDAHRSLIMLDQQPDGATIDATFEVKSDEPAPILAARLVTRMPAGAPLPPIKMRLATTRGTNALLERRGAPVALFITEGFGDLLLIGDQQRPDLFSLHIKKPPPLYQRVCEVRERLAADGSILIELDRVSVAAQASRLFSEGIRVAAVALMHSYINDRHERAVAQLLRQAGFDHVSISSELSPLIRLLPRTQTAVVNAYLSPVIENYLQHVSRSALKSNDPEPKNCAAPFSLHVLTSAGGLVSAPAYRACDSLLSGPAGGVAGAAAAGRGSGFSRIIGFDMGGTSTDVARYDGDFEYRFEHTVAGARVMAPALAIQTVAAGGGSICDWIDDRLIVGPQSAGAEPGPACYGAGGPLTLTDVNLLLGRLDAQRFEIPIDLEMARAAAKVCLRAAACGLARSPTDIRSKSHEAVLEGFLEIANQRMAAAIEAISVRQGYDPKDYALVAFGGAGGQHACAIADRLGIQTVVVPADAAVLSAVGLGHAVIERFAHKQVLQQLERCAAQIPTWLAEHAQQAKDAVAAEGVHPAQIVVRRAIIDLRLLGQDATLSIDLPCAESQWNQAASAPVLESLFAQRYRVMYGHDPGTQSDKPIEVESMRVIASSMSPVQDTTESNARSVKIFEPSISAMTNAYFEGRWMNVPAYERDQLQPGALLHGPSLVWERRSACVIESGWNATVDPTDALVLRRDEPAGSQPVQNRPEAVQDELFSNRLTSIAEEMGQMLQRIALSTNVKERLDFSCAVLDAHGELVVNAPHIPVHLGALGMCVRAVREAISMEDGDVIVTNHPAYGGSHLPDVTVITPVFGEAGPLIGYVANRAHHAEIGGTRPGSMPPAAQNLAEEGVVIAPRYLVRKGQKRFEEIESALRGKPYPSRAVNDNLADLRAAVAANHRGANALRALADQYGPGETAFRMDAIKARAERLMRHALQQLPDGIYQATERLDDGSPIQVSLTVAGDRAMIDFSGSAATHPGNLNATPAIVCSAVMYVLRLMIGEPVPLNEGIMRAVELNIPEGMLNPIFDVDPAKSPAVVGGNTETSQRIVDTLLKALRLCACSQGTMNNVLFGNDRMGYYETVCGGSGAGPAFHGSDAVHTHMTNTRITDPEIIEHRYPVRLERFAIRRGSGGAGRWRGGDGVVREITFLETMSLSVLTQHRAQGPFGMDDGQAGAPGRQRLIRASGQIIELGSIDGLEAATGDRLILETPGGGGYGPAEK